MEAVRQVLDSDLGEIRSQRDRLRETLERVGADAREVLLEAQRLAESTLDSLRAIRTEADGADGWGPSRGGDLEELRREIERERESTRSLREEIEDQHRRLRLSEARIRDLEAQCEAKDRRIREFERALDPR